MRSRRLLLIVVALLSMAAQSDESSGGRRAVLPAGSAVDSFWTPDLAVVLRWDPGALPPSDVTFDVAPVAVDTPLLGGKWPAGAAYRVDIEPDGWLTDGIELRLAVRRATDGVYHSVDGVRWERLERRGGADGSEIAVLTRSGLVVAIAARASASPPAGGAFVFAGAGAAALALAWLATRRGRARHGSPQPVKR